VTRHVKLPRAIVRLSQPERRLHRAHVLRTRVPSIVLGATLIAGIVGANAVVLSRMGAANAPIAEGPTAIQPEVAVAPESDLGFECAMPGLMMMSADEACAEVDPAYPSAPEIALSGQIKPGVMTTIEPLDHGCRPVVQW
jgi:hypothetical protein